MKKTLSARRITLLAAFSAAAVAISAVENMLPALPVLPAGTKAGFSNVIVMFLAAEYSLPSAILVAVFKAVFALFTRGVLASAMSLAGGVLSALAIYLCAKGKGFGYVGLGIVGAAFHNIGQLAVAYFAVGGSIRFYAPVMILLGTVTGTVTGLLLKLLTPTVNKLLKEG